jgi:protocatechuate 3,4-dioxygenase beta subunit
MKPIAVLLLVLVAVGALIFGLFTLGGSKSGGNANPVNIDSTATAQKPTKPADVEKPMESEHRAEPVKPEEARASDGQFVYSNELRVQVIDSQKKPIQDVEVTLTSLSTNDVFFMDNGKAAYQVGPLRTGADGRVSFRGVKPSTSSYTLVCMHPDYARQERPTLAVDQEGVFEEPPIMLVPGAMLQGTVKDEQGGPIPEAHLVLEGPLAQVQESRAPDRLEAKTDGAGMYQIKNIPRGAARTLSVSAPGYGRTIAHGLNFPDDRAKTQDFVLRTAEMITGRVVAAGNKPLVKVKLMALALNGTLQTARDDQETNDRGEFSFESLVPGDYNIVATLKGWRIPPQNRIHTNTANLVLEASPMASVCGQVVDSANGAPVTQFTVQLRSFTDAISPTTPMPETMLPVSDASGNFCLEGVEQGTYVVEAWANGLAPTRTQSFAIANDRNVEHLVVRLTPGGSISGRLVDPDKKPIDKALVQTKPNDWADDDFTKMLEGMYPSNVTQSEVRTGPDGSFVIKNLSPDLYQLVFEGSTFTSACRKDVSVTEGTNNNLGDVVMTRGGTLVGTVLDASGKPVPGAGVQIYTADSNEPRMYQTKSDGEGKFVLRRVAQGRYKARPSPPAGANSNPLEDLRIGADAERQITVVDDQETQLDLTLPVSRPPSAQPVEVPQPNRPAPVGQRPQPKRP